MSINKRNMITELPFGLPGRIFRSPMPFGTYDPYGYALEEYHLEGVATIVMLATDDECMLKAGRNLRQIYAQQGYKVIYFPIEDFSIPPSLHELDRIINELLQCAGNKENIAIHCSAGIGRTGLFVACLATRALNCSTDEAMDWVRKYIPGAVETTEQEEFVLKYK
jgi:protein-tyrosine phosphatase